MLGNEIYSEPAFAEVLDGGSEAIDLVINDEETIVGTLELMDVDRGCWVLKVMCFYCGLDGIIIATALHVDVASDSWGTIGESCKDCIISITIYEDYARSCFAYQLLHELEGIECLAIEIDAHEWCGLRLLEALKDALNVGDLLLELLLTGM